MHLRTRIRLALNFTALIVIAAGFISAQTNNGEVTGRITDKSDAIVVDAHVAVRNIETGDVRETTSNKDGYFVVTFLPPGIYEVSGAAPGFKKVIQSNIRLGAGQRSHISLALEVGAVSESVTVSAALQQVNTEDAKVRHVIDAEQAKDLPLNGRIMSHLLMLVPGIAVTTDLGVTDIAATLTNYSANGARGVYNLASVDGGFNLDSGSMGSQTNQVSPDWVQEVSIVTSGYSAEYGRFGNGVNLVNRRACRIGCRECHANPVIFKRHAVLRREASHDRRHIGTNRVADRSNRDHG